MEIAIKVWFTCLVMLIISTLGLRFSPVPKNRLYISDYFCAGLLFVSGTGLIISLFCIIWLY